jgi:tRNA G26 N,N-dimethylase Trm1
LSLDKEAFIFFCQHAGASAEALKEGYKQYKKVYALNEEFVDVGNNIMHTVGPFYQGNISLEQVVAGVASLKDNHELKLKQQFEVLIQEKVITAGTKDDLLNQVVAFNSKQYVYFANNEFMNHELQELCDLVMKTAEAVQDYKFDCYKAMIVKQLESTNKIKQ